MELVDKTKSCRSSMVWFPLSTFFLFLLILSTETVSRASHFHHQPLVWNKNVDLGSTHFTKGPPVYSMAMFRVLWHSKENLYVLISLVILTAKTGDFMGLPCKHRFPMFKIVLDDSISTTMWCATWLLFAVLRQYWNKLGSELWVRARVGTLWSGLLEIMSLHGQFHVLHIGREFLVVIDCQVLFPG
jgi:hypothetical protein